MIYTDIKTQLIEKSKEAFVLAIEIYNKPTLHYRLEGFSFLVCNAWELMLKAHLINKNGNDSIYYKDKQDRTISLEKCIQLVFTNKNTPLRLNLEKIIELRNTSTHFITEEYEMLYVPLLQSCVYNFVEKIKEFHGVDMYELIPQNFINLSVKINCLTDSEIRGKYTRQISERLINRQNELIPMIQSMNNGFAIPIEHHYYMTKDASKATEVFRVDKNAAEPARIIKEIKDPNQSYKFTAKDCIKEINSRLKREGIELLRKGIPQKLNMHYFTLINKYYGIKYNERFCFAYRVSRNPQYSYSMQAIEFIVEEIKKAPDRLLDDLKQNVKKNANPGSKGF